MITNSMNRPAHPPQMTPAELEPIVTAWGGVEKFAAIIHASPRTVYGWLDGTRRIRPLQAELIRSLRVVKDAATKEGI